MEMKRNGKGTEIEQKRYGIEWKWNGKGTLII